MEKTIKRIPIARCPVPDCGRTLMYSGDPKDKHTVMLSIASDGYQGKTMILGKELKPWQNAEKQAKAR